MKTVASADALTFLRLTFHPKNKNGAKTQNFSCSVIKCYHICHLIFLLAPVLLCIGKREHRKKMWVMIMRISCLRKKKTWIRFFLSWRNGGKFSFHLPVFHFFFFSHQRSRENLVFLHYTFLNGKSRWPEDFSQALNRNSYLQFGSVNHVAKLRTQFSNLVWFSIFKT